VLKVNTDDQAELAGRYRVQGIPDFLVTRGGQAKCQQAGVVSAQQMKSWLQSAQA
jgi:thioredoxin-like negative regulator of GroEL